ncbi:hypothetical protein IHE44_0001095 [Lamprotornis superbus]|uniref:Zinc finger protein 704 n=1 Tax=Lamprotornis superbus TaxID=245042 RepID=A0A835TV41_9PASS|nr:hypothetical protein IHE44_0001095 [Lamprotornis superbus]
MKACYTPTYIPPPPNPASPSLENSLHPCHAQRVQLLLNRTEPSSAPDEVEILGREEGSYAAQAANIKREMTFHAFQQEDVKSDISRKLPDQQFLLFTTKEEDLKTAETKKLNRAHEYEKENTRSVCLLEQKRKVVSSNIDVPPASFNTEGKIVVERIRGAPQLVQYLCEVTGSVLSRKRAWSSDVRLREESAIYLKNLKDLMVSFYPLRPGPASCRMLLFLSSFDGSGALVRKLCLAHTQAVLGQLWSVGEPLQHSEAVPHGFSIAGLGKSSEELDMDKVTAAMVLTSLSTSPLVRSPPVRPNESLNGSWKEGGFVPSSTSSSGYWSWNAPSDQSNPSTPSPPLSADSFKAFRTPSQPDDGIDEGETSNLLFDEPIPRKRKTECVGILVNFAIVTNEKLVLDRKESNIYSKIRRFSSSPYLQRVGESDYSDGEEDFYYTEIRLNTDSVADGLSSLSPVSPSLASPPSFPTQDTIRPETSCAKTETKVMTPLSRSAPTNLYLVHTDHAYQATPPVNIPGSAKFTPNGSSFSISWQSPPVTFTGIPVSPTHNRPAGSGEQKQSHTVLSSPPRVAFGLRKPRGEGKKCRKVYGMENRDMWCTACRWKKACQRPFVTALQKDLGNRNQADYDGTSQKKVQVALLPFNSDGNASKRCRTEEC